MYSIFNSLMHFLLGNSVDKVTNIANFPFSEEAYNNGLFHVTWTGPGATIPEHCGGDEQSDATINSNTMDMSGICDQPANPGFSKYLEDIVIEIHCYENTIHSQLTM